MAGKESAPALDDVRTKAEPEAGRDSPQRQGDKLGVATGTAAGAGASEALAGDSPKRQGDALKHAVDEAAKS